jgi:hypothetical protein
MTEHVRFLSGVLLALGAEKVTVSLTDFSGGRLDGLLAAVRQVSDAPRVEVVDDPNREDGRRYYEEFAFDISIELAGQTFSVVDGGLVDWGKKLVASRKERMLISGIGVDRLAGILG